MTDDADRKLGRAIMGKMDAVFVEMCMTDDARAVELRKLDEEVARLRGWTFSPDGARGNAHWRPAPVGRDEPLSLDLAWFHSVRLVMDPEPPPFSREWALAGPLLTEMRGSVEWLGLAGDDTPWRATGFLGGDDLVRPAPARDVTARGATPTEAIARSWLAWKRGR
jgi:hypothetical protein